VRDDFSEFSDDRRVNGWRDHLPSDADLEVLLDEALGHAVRLRDKLYDDADLAGARIRSLHMVDVLNRLRAATRS
jgi:hypothetical protein